MNKKQWYALGSWFAVIGGIAYLGTVSGPMALPTIAECNAYILITTLVGKLVGALCLTVSVACWICGWYEEGGSGMRASEHQQGCTRINSGADWLGLRIFSIGRRRKERIDR